MKQLLVFLICIAGYVSPVKAAVLKGLVLDAQTGEELIGAAVFLKDDPATGTITGLDGSFVLKNVPDDRQLILVCSYISYEAQEQLINPAQTQTVLFNLQPSSMTLDDVVIIATVDKTTDNNARALEKKDRKSPRLNSSHR